MFEKLRAHPARSHSEIVNSLYEKVCLFVMGPALAAAACLVLLPVLATASEQDRAIQATPD